MVFSILKYFLEYWRNGSRLSRLLALPEVPGFVLRGHMVAHNCMKLVTVYLVTISGLSDTVKYGTHTCMKSKHSYT